MTKKVTKKQKTNYKKTLNNSIAKATQIIKNKSTIITNKQKKKTNTTPTSKIKKQIIVTKIEEKNAKTNNGIYVHFKSPKYFNFARKLSKLSDMEVKIQVEKYKLTLQEKIHTGNLLSNLASKVCQHGEYSQTKKAYYYDLNKYNDLYNQCMSKTRVELQRICSLNEMPKSAKKEVLAERVADGLLLGKIPKCPNCCGGRLRFNNQDGTYFCPGFIDGGHFYSDLGDDYVFCNKKFPLNEIQRTEFLK